MDLFGNEERPQLVIEHDDQLAGTHDGTVCVHAGAELTVLGNQRGTVSFRSGSTGVVVGAIRGSLHVASGAIVVIQGGQHGSVQIDHWGVVRVDAGGKLAGSLHVDGLVENRGIRGGAASGGGEIRDVDGGQVMQPLIVNGVHFYNW
jgi:hypothetical protein